MSERGKQAVAFVLGGVFVGALMVGLFTWATFNVGGVLDPPTKTKINKQGDTLEPGHSISYALPVSDRKLIEVDVVERFGKNIEFRLLSNGLQVGASGVHLGHAVGSFIVEEGTASLVVENNNLLESKSVIVTVKASKLAVD